MTDACRPQRPGPARRDASSQRGSVLVWAAFVILMVLGVIASGTSSDQAHDALASALKSRRRRAGARRGRCRRRGRLSPGSAASRCSRCTAFRRAATSPPCPPVNETDDAAAGPGARVRDHCRACGAATRCGARRAAEAFVDGDGDGRYDAGESFTDADGNGALGRQRAGRVTSRLERGMPGLGAVWSIESRGLLYDRPRADLPLGAPPNELLASARVSSEVRRLTILPPAAAALVGAGALSRSAPAGGCAAAPGGGAGLPQRQRRAVASGAEVTRLAGERTRCPTTTRAWRPCSASARRNCAGMAGLSRRGGGTCRRRCRPPALVVVEGDITFDAARPLGAAAVVVVLGDCTVAARQEQLVQRAALGGGALTVRAPATCAACWSPAGTVDVRGTGGDLAEIEHDDRISELLALIGQYRHSKTLYRARGARRRVGRDPLVRDRSPCVPLRGFTLIEVLGWRRRLVALASHARRGAMSRAAPSTPSGRATRPSRARRRCRCSPRCAPTSRVAKARWRPTWTAWTTAWALGPTLTLMSGPDRPHGEVVAPDHPISGEQRSSPESGAGSDASTCAASRAWRRATCAW